MEAHKKQKIGILTLSFLVSLTSCTSIRKTICTGCLEPLSDNEAVKYRNMTLTKFIDERFTDKLSKIDPNVNYNKVDKRTGEVILQTLSYHINRPHDDLAKFCSANGGKLIFLSQGNKPKYRDLEEIKRDSKHVYNNAKHSAPSQISIDTGLGIQSTYDIDKNEYALNQARSYYQQEIHNKVKFENSTIAKQYDEHRLGNFGACCVNAN